nr:hypothetical protein BaRGS_028225 [Batillaria attramentaria]
MALEAPSSQVLDLLFDEDNGVLRKELEFGAKGSIETLNFNDLDLLSDDFFDLLQQDGAQDSTRIAESAASLKLPKKKPTELFTKAKAVIGDALRLPPPRLSLPDLMPSVDTLDPFEPDDSPMLLPQSKQIASCFKHLNNHLANTELFGDTDCILPTKLPAVLADYWC